MPRRKVFQGDGTCQRAVFINDEQLAVRCSQQFSRTPLMFSSCMIGVYLRLMTFFTRSSPSGRFRGRRGY